MKRFSFLSISPLRRIALVVALHNAWFWVPIWVLYYRRFTNYSGVALLEALSMGISMAMIVPGGILSDWIGRKRLLILASICGFVGSFCAGIAPSFAFLICSILLLSLAGGLYQSSIHALIYDTLKIRHHERRYEQVLGKFITIQMIATACASAIGGWLYSIDPRYPWFMGAFALGTSGFVAFTIIEPRLETPHDSFIQFLREAGKGMSLLIAQQWRIGIPLIVMGIFLTMDASGLWDIQAVEFGYSSTELGILLTLVFLALAASSAFMPMILRNVEERTVIIRSVGLFAILWMISSLVSGWIGGALLIMRSSTAILFDIKSSVIWNRMIPSSIRATTLSTITILRGIPYILLAFSLGILLDTMGIRPIVRVLSFCMFGVCIGTWMLWRGYGYKKKQ